MSGGTFDYGQFKIGTIADDIQRYLDVQGTIVETRGWDGHKKYTNPIYPPEVQDAMKAGIKALKIAEIYAHRIDYFLSGDDGDENFLKRLQDELDEIK